MYIDPVNTGRSKTPTGNFTYMYYSIYTLEIYTNDNIRFGRLNKDS
jgi:hypothetical protein